MIAPIPPMQEDALDVSVVIPAFGDRGHLQDVIGALQKQSPSVREIIVSHSGTDPAPEFPRHPSTPVEVLHSVRRLYSGAARNRGAARATSRWLAFLDDDVIPDDAWARRVAAAISRADRYCIVGAVDHDLTGGYWGLCLWFVEFGSVHGYMPERVVEGGASANMVVSADLYRRCGGFCETRTRSVDVEFMARCRAQGTATRFDPRIVVRHRNMPGYRHCLRHCLSIGRGSADLRRHADLRAGITMTYPLVAPLLMPARALLMAYRVLRWGRGQRLRFALLYPGILCALAAWTYGYTSVAWQGEARG